MLEKLDALAGVERGPSAVVWLERISFVFLVLMVVSAPHSIAATQTAWLTGMFLWIVRLFFRPGVRSKFGWLDVLLWTFFVWSVVTSIVSYAPDISVNKLRGAAVFLIFYFVFYNARNLPVIRFLAAALILSCMVNVVWTPIQRLIGRGVEIHGVAPNGPLARAQLTDGDTLLTANGRKLKTPDDLLAALNETEQSRVLFYRPDFDFEVIVKRADLLEGATAGERLGVGAWKKSHNWRSMGFYGHYTTYAEVLQLIAALVFGLLLACFLAKRAGPNGDMRSSSLAVLGVVFALMCLALFLTVTRASQLGLLVAVFAIVMLGGSRKLLVASAVLVLPIIIGGLIFLQQSRNVGFLDPADDSTRYRMTMWRDGVRIWTESPRNFVFGVGMDSIQRYWHEWGMFDGGRLPMGHFHSTPIQLLVECGLPSLLIWLAVLAVYLSMLWRGLKVNNVDGAGWIKRGMLLGCMGGAVGFFTSSLVHYNLGDQEVAMVFYLLMGLGVRTAEIVRHSDQYLPAEAAVDLRMAA